MIQTPQPQKNGKRDRNPINQLELCDDSLEPLARAGDIAIINPFREPAAGNLIALRVGNRCFVKYCHLYRKSISLRDRRGQFKTLPLAEIEILGVVHSILRPVQ